MARKTATRHFSSVYIPIPFFPKISLILCSHADLTQMGCFQEVSERENERERERNFHVSYALKAFFFCAICKTLQIFIYHYYTSV
jgi:hypothetical protein